MEGLSVITLGERMRMTATDRPQVLFVGAFPPADKRIFGGNVTACRALMQSSFPERIVLDLIDSTQISNPPPSFIVRLAYAAKRFFKFAARLERNKPDAVLLFTSAGASLVEKGMMSWYSRVRGRPALLFPRGGAIINSCSTSRLVRLLVKTAFRGASKILCQGSAWQEFAVGACGFDKSDAPIVRNWTASDEFLSIGRQRILDARKGALRLLFVGWVERGKGVLELIEACHILVHKMNKEIVVNLVGGGHAVPEVQHLVKRYGLDDRVRICGWADGAQLRKYYSESDVLVLPSHAEGLPNAMIEAMAAGLAVVVTPVGNIPDVINDAENGLIVPSGDPQALGAAIARLADEPELLSKVAASGYASARDRFSVEPAVERLVDVINDVVK